MWIYSVKRYNTNSPNCVKTRFFSLREALFKTAEPPEPILWLFI